jgi:serine/threonine protein kinase
VHHSKICENGRFEKIYSNSSIIGKGTFGEVFKAKKLTDNHSYALKRVYFNLNLDDQNLPLFAEVEALKKATHENLVRYYTFWIEELNI